MFGEGYARRQAARYRKRGLDGTEQRIVDFLDGRGLEGASVLEIGGGVGHLQLELLRRGAARATNLELVDVYEAESRRLATEAGMAGRVERRRLDIAATPQQVEPADVVVLSRVVCCYPDYEGLLGAAADHARRLLVFSYPPRNLGSRAVLGSQNALFRLTGKTFRTFAHPTEGMLGVLERRGLRRAYSRGGLVWSVAGLERVPA